jgi:L-ascorbate metabolism protein UlaG (beta-lactamase superfamily)
MNKRIIKKMSIGLGIIIALVIISFTLFLYLSPQFGKRASAKQQLEYAMAENYKDGKFLNKEEIAMKMNARSIFAMIKEVMNPHPEVMPKSDIKVIPLRKDKLVNENDTQDQIIWLGHSSFYMKLDGKIILFDPVFSQKTGPHPWVGRAKYNSKMPFDIDEIPWVDAVFISHDHYDHLDYDSILKLKDKTGNFFLPLGVDNHLLSWGVDANKIKTFNWWDEHYWKGIDIAFTPSRHMSGRGLSDQSATLWGGWVIKSQNQSIYYSGDGGYGLHFKEIGNKYGPFDIGLMECGQYNKLWADVHMMPEESAQAGKEVGAKLLIPMHWATYKLATHSWTDPIERFTLAAQKHNLEILTPEIGEQITLKSPQMVQKQWWTNK